MLCKVLVNSAKLSLQYTCRQVGRILFFILDELLSVYNCLLNYLFAKQLVPYG